MQKPDLPPSQVASALDMRDFLIRDDGRGGSRVAKDSKTLGSAYDRYLQGTEFPSYNVGEATPFSGASLGRGISMGEPSLLGHPESIAPDVAPIGRDIGYGDQRLFDSMARPVRETVPLPSDASNTLYVEGLPPSSTRREVARILSYHIMRLNIFRPFVGYKEVRLVTKESKHRGGDPLILCFVDFVDAACAATALSALQGYKMDEDDRDSAYLRIQFSRHPGPRSGGGPRGRH
ncbi:RNA-binding protein 2 [Bienertia sinuspersici]